jgi:hypothetical protein
MKPLLYLMKIVSLTGIMSLLLVFTGLQAQICQNPSDTIYGMDLAGQLYPLNVNDASPGAMLGSTGSGLNSNGLGFSSLDGKFYFFNRCNTNVLGDTIQFVSFNPSTGITQILADPPATFTTAQKIRSGCINNLGSGYYTINPAVGTAGTPRPSLYFFDIASNTWTTIAEDWVDGLGNSLNTTLRTLNSGDMAFDGNGNLWILASNNSQYALYRVNAPVPTSGLVTITAHVVVPVTATPSGGGVSITGLAFNAAGVPYLSTGGTTGVPTPAHNNLYRLTSAGVMDSIGKLPNDYGGDLTSCSYPLNILAARDKKSTHPVNPGGTNGSHTLYAGPNPAKDVLYIYSGGYAVNHQAQIFDRLGRLVYTGRVTQGRQSLNISGLPKGTYVIRLVSVAHQATVPLQFIKW